MTLLWSITYLRSIPLFKKLFINDRFSQAKQLRRRRQRQINETESEFKINHRWNNGINCDVMYEKVIVRSFSPLVTWNPKVYRSTASFRQYFRSENMTQLIRLQEQKKRRWIGNILRRIFFLFFSSIKTDVLCCHRLS